MTHYNTLNVKLFNSKLSKLKPEIKYKTEVTLNLSSNLIGNSNNENNFPHKLLLTNTQVSKICKGFANGSAANIKFSKTHLHKIGQSGGYLGRRLRPLLKTGFPLIANVLKPLAKSALIPLRLAAASATDATIDKNIFGSGNTTLIVSNEEVEDIMKIVKSLEVSGLLVNRISKTIKNETNKQKGGFFPILLGTLYPSLLGSALTGKGVIRAGEGAIRVDENV